MCRQYYDPNSITDLEFMDIFADNLKEEMNIKGYNQQQLAEEANISQSSINKYLNRRQIVSLRALYNICLVLDCDIKDLLPYNGMIRWK